MDFDVARDIAPRLFADSYAQARQKFLAAAPQARAYPSRAKGPAGEDLFTDVAYYGDAQAPRLLVLVSATHGPEGYCGSAAQLHFLHAGLHERLPQGTAVLIVHALNCYGFAWDRRVTAEGCDLNRNFIDFSQPVPANPGFEELAPYFVPKDLSPEGLARAEAAIQAYRERHGEWQFQTARKSGQYTVPGSVGFGGQGPTEARLTLEQIGRDYGVAERSQVVILDYHTGLGPYGYGELQCESVSGLAGYERALAIFGPSATTPELGTSASMALHGTQDEYWERLLGARHTYLAFEFGTFDPVRARTIQREDLWLFKYHPEAVDAALGRRIRQASKDYFYPQAADWKEMVVWRAHQVHRQALAALGSSR